MSEAHELWRAELTFRKHVVLEAPDGNLAELLTFETPGVARRVVACVNALRGIPTESVEFMDPLGWPQVIASVFEEMQQERAGLPSAEDLDVTATEAAVRLATAERVIEYEVPEHPWASEEGCAPRLPWLDDAPAAEPRRVTHEQAAKEAGSR